MRITNGCVLTMDDDLGVIADGEVQFTDKTITYVGPRSTAPDLPGPAIDAQGGLICPGFVQAHTHLCQTLFRNQADDLELLDWLRLRIWPLEAAHDKTSIATSAELGIGELLRSGTTAILDMGTVNHTDVLFDVALRTGIRATIGKCHMDVDAGQPRALLEETSVSIESARALCEDWHNETAGRLRYAFAPRFAISCSEELLRAVGAMAHSYDTQLHTHASENTEECRIIVEQTGCTNVDYFRGLDLCDHRLVLAHCVHVTGDEMATMAKGGVNVTHCPSSNLKLASGIAPVPEMLAHGINVALGADGAACNNNLDMMTEMRLAALLHKPKSGPTSMPAKTVCHMATVAGARALGLHDVIGRLKPGMAADVIVISGSELRCLPAGDPYAQLVYASQSHQVRHVFVAGIWVVQDGQLVSIDAKRLSRVANEQLKALRSRAQHLTPS